MLTSFLLTSAILLVIFVVSVLHLPLWLRRLIYYVPAWLQCATIHFAYGGWVGGVTGHVVGGLLSVPWFFICRYYLQPRIGREMTDAWARNPIKRVWDLRPRFLPFGGRDLTPALPNAERLQ